MPKFGILTTDSGLSNVIIQSISKKGNAEIAEARDQNGAIIALHAYSKSSTVEIRALLDADSVTTEAGQLITIGSQNYIIESTSQDESNTGWAEVSLTAKTADSATVTALDAKEN